MNDIETLELENKLREYIKKDRSSMLAWAYMLGRKDVSIEYDKVTDVERLAKCGGCIKHG